MPDDLTEYAGFFAIGGRVRVGIPVAQGKNFQEWGIVSSLKSDLLELELSRDSLPQAALLKLGATLNLRPAGQEGRCCRGVLVREGQRGALALRLVDGVVAFEQREFYRQDVYVPVDYRIPPVQNVADIRERWRLELVDREFAAQVPEPGEDPEIAHAREEIRSRLERRAAVTPVAANLSGGGMRIVIPERLEPGQLVEVTIYLPHPKRAVELVAEVVEPRNCPSSGGFNTALRFRFIEEADRDRIVGFISAEQLAQLARLGLGKPSEDFAARGGEGPLRLRIAVGILVLALLVGYLSHSIVEKRERGEKHEIQRLFEAGIAKYLKQRR